MSSTTRNILGSFVRLYARPEASPRLLFATLSGERHEIGTLGAAMLAVSSGLRVAYLGPDLPARELRTIVRDLPNEVELWAGGRGAARHTALISPRGLILVDYNAYQHELARIGGRVAA